MRSGWLAAIVLTTGCGRFGFDATATGGLDSGDGGDSGDAGPPARTRIVPILGATGVNGVAFDAAGRLAVIGEFAGSITIGGMTMPTPSATLDIFVAVVDATDAATRLWVGGATQFGSGQNVAWFPDGTLATGSYFAGTLTNGGNLDAGSRQAAFVATFDPAGALDFARHYGATGNVQARGVAASANRIGVVGLYAGSVDFGAGPLPSTAFDNGFVATMDRAGADVRSRAFTAGNDVIVNDIAFEPGGDVFIGGRLLATTDFGLGPASPEPGGPSAFLGRFDANLAPRWVRVFGSSTNLTDLEVLSNGDCVAVGQVNSTINIDGSNVTSAGGSDGWVGRFGATGTAAWIRTLGGGDTDIIQTVTVTGERIVVGGAFAGTAQLVGARSLTSDGGNDGVVAGLDLDGALVWATQLGGTGSLDIGLGGMSVDPTGLHVAIPSKPNGALIVDGESATVSTSDGAVILVAIPQN